MYDKFFITHSSFNFKSLLFTSSLNQVSQCIIIRFFWPKTCGILVSTLKDQVFDRLFIAPPELVIHELRRKRIVFRSGDLHAKGVYFEKRQPIEAFIRTIRIESQTDYSVLKNQGVNPLRMHFSLVKNQ